MKDVKKDMTGEKPNLEVKKVKTEKYKGSWLLRIAILCFTAFMSVSLLSQQIKISEKKEELDALNAQMQIQQLKNEDLTYTMDNESELSDYAEKVARNELNYANAGERIYVNVGGSD